jgi:asparagine synthase (glutamine-hydrolysing)
VSVPAFAGIHDPRRSLGDRERREVAQAVGDLGAVRSLCCGALVLAWTGSAEPAGEPLCFVDGDVYDFEGVSRPSAACLADGWREHGEPMLARLRGDFVVLFYDPTNDAGVFARDHLGGRGLVWHFSDGRLTFASEVRFLLPLLAATPDPDSATLGHWLAHGRQPGDRTLHAGVHRLEPAHLLGFGDAPPVAWRYWTPRYREPDPGDLADHADGLRSVLDTAVDRRCERGSASTGVLLSGGLDSSTVAALATGLDTDRRVARSYSATFPAHPSVDETALINLLCRDLALDGTRADVRGGSVLAGAIEYIAHWQVPPPSPNLFFWLPLLRRAARDGVEVLLDGEGGDELFGLSPYLLADRVRRARLYDAVDLVRRIPGGGPHLNRASIWRFVRDYGIKGAVPGSMQRAVRRGRGAGRYAPPWLRANVARAVFDADTTTDWKDLDGPRWWSHLVAVTTRGAGGGMTYDHVRRRAALAGLQARHPLVDVDVVEYVLGLPPELAFDPRHSRPLLRAAMTGRLPDEVRLRATKSYFDAVFHESLAGADLPVARDLLAPGDAALAPYVDLEAVGERLLASPPPPAQRQGWAIALWRLLTAECWLRARDGRLPRPPHNGQIRLYSSPRPGRLLGSRSEHGREGRWPATNTTSRRSSTTARSST